MNIHMYEYVSAGKPFETYFHMPSGFMYVRNMLARVK